MYNPTESQSRFIEAVMTAVNNGGNQSFMVNAVPGAGKTTTAQHLFSLLPKNYEVIATTYTRSARDASRFKFSKAGAMINPVPPDDAFNKMYSEAVTNRNGATAFFPNVNQLGFAMLRHAFPNIRWEIPRHTNKWYDPVNAYIKKMELPKEDWKVELKYRQSIMIAIDALRSNYLPLDNPDTCCEVLMSQGIVLNCDAIIWAIDIIQDNLAQIRAKLENVGTETISYKFRPQIWIDFDDQIYLPLVLGANSPDVLARHGKQPFLVDMVIGDEVQNSTIARCLLMEYALKPNGIFIGLGDPYQAVMGFAGASQNVWMECRQIFDAKEYTFPDSFRFGEPIANELRFMTDVVGRGFSFKPDHWTILSARYVRATAEIKSMADIQESFRNDNAILPTDIDAAVITRTNADMVAVALMLKKADIPFRFENDNFVEATETQLTELYKSFQNPFKYDADRFANHIEETWEQKQRYMRSFAPQYLIDAMKQKYDTCYTLVRGITHATYEDLKREIESIFRSKSGIVLTTAHSSQSKEYKHVYLLCSGFYFSFMRHFNNTAHPYNLYSEAMLWYVGISRAMEKVTYIDGFEEEFAMGNLVYDAHEAIGRLAAHAVNIYTHGIASTGNRSLDQDLLGKAEDVLDRMIVAYDEGYEVDAEHEDLVAENYRLNIMRQRLGLDTRTVNPEDIGIDAIEDMENNDFDDTPNAAKVERGDYDRAILGRRITPIRRRKGEPISLKEKDKATNKTLDTIRQYQFPFDEEGE